MIAEAKYFASHGTLMQLSVPNPDAAAALISEKWLYSAQKKQKKKRKKEEREKKKKKKEDNNNNNNKTKKTINQTGSDEKKTKSDLRPSDYQPLIGLLTD